MQIKRQNFLKLKSAIKQPFSSGGVILSPLQVSNLRIHVRLGFVDSLAVDLLLGASFIDKYVRGFFSTERKLLPWQLQPVDIIV